jgi:[ribosomal protein S5]-alanine N-acetyltransferase
MVLVSVIGSRGERVKAPGQPFDTERMHFRLLHDTDLDAVYRQFSDPEMCEYFSEPPMDLQAAQQTINFFQHPERDPYLRYGMFDRTSGELIGTCGYHHLDRELNQAELGYDVWKEHWRKGYASEALKPLIDMCFHALGVNQVYVLIDRNNLASIRTAEKFGFRVSEPCRPLDEPGQVCMKLNRTGWDSSQSRKQ